MRLDYIGAYNGSIFYPTNESTDDVNLEAIAFALSNNSRFCGHTNKFWSIAQHSMLVAKFIENELAYEIYGVGLDVDKAMLYGLLHDASEAYLSDICRPIKQFLPDYADYENLVQTKILRAFGIEDEAKEYRKYVKIADDTILYAEATVLMNPNDKWKLDYADGFNLKSRVKYERFIDIENPQIVEAKFIHMCMRLCKLLNLLDTPAEKLGTFNIGQDIALYKNGISEYTFTEDSNNFVFVNRSTGITSVCNKGIANNTIDIFKLIKDGVEHED